MKLSEMFESGFEVREHKTKKLRFHGTRTACIKWIKHFDKTNPGYLDLRIVDSGGREYDWHAAEK